MKNPKKLIFTTLLCGLTVFTALGFFVLYFWLTKDEAPLDYSSLDVPSPMADPTVNGYTALRLLSANSKNTNETFEDIAVLLQQHYKDTNQALTLEYLDEHQVLLYTLDEAFAKPLFQFDQAATPETTLPKISDLRIYVALKALQSRHLAHNGAVAEALKELQDLHTRITTYAECGGPLITLLVAMNLIDLTDQEFSKFITHYVLPSEIWQSSTQSYQVNETYALATSNAFKQEFQFASHCIKLLEDDPSIVVELSDSEVSSDTTRKLINSAAHYFLKENLTRNIVFQSYSEISEQAILPLKFRDLAYSSSLMNRLEDKDEMTIFSKNPLGNLMLAILIPSYSQVLQVVCTQQASASATQLSFALKNYYQDYEELPSTLNQLVPQYIKAIPLDPFDGEPMRYSKNKAIIYSVGTDFVDNGGSQSPFRFTSENIAYNADVAEKDKIEPTFPLRFAMELK